MIAIVDFLTKIKNTAFSIGIIDIIEILIMAFVLYKIFYWMKNTRAWVILKGIVAILFFILIAEMLQLNTILFILKSASGVIVIAFIVVFQPELRGALETLGKGNILANVFKKDKRNVKIEERISMEREIINAVNSMAKAKTGALIAIENEDSLGEYIKTGISLDAKVSASLLMNIFEHNTPLHDGAVIISGNRIVSATSYFPISTSNTISKAYGTRHRAAVGLGEKSDAIAIIVSEETGRISLAKEGKLIEDVTPEVIIAEIDKIYTVDDKERKRGNEDEETEETAAE